MKKAYCLVLIGTCLLFNNLFSQSLAVNTTGATADASAILDVNSSSKGILVPRVSLSATNVAAPLSSPLTSLLVYNTATAGTSPANVTPGYYYWNGSQWSRLIATADNSVWKVTGNSGMVDGTNFIGTTDDVPLNFMVNNIKAGRLSTTNEETFWGVGAGNSSTGKSNTFIGNFAGHLNTSGRSNTVLGVAALNSNSSSSNLVAIGDSALYTNTGTANTAIGSKALYKNSSGTNNSATGYNALFNNTTGGNNTATGVNALYGNVDGFNNTATGLGAMFSNTSGSGNTATGRLALNSNTTGYGNIAMGNQAMFNNTSGYSNTAVGSSALLGNGTGYTNTAIGEGALLGNSSGYSNVAIGVESLYSSSANNQVAVGDSSLRSSTGSGNTALGSKALYNTGTGTNNTAAGYNALLNNTLGANNVSLGYNTGSTNTTGSNNTLIGYTANVSSAALTNATALGNGATVSASNKVRLGNASVTVVEGQVSYTFPSDGRFKKDVREDVKGLDFIMRLRPVTYNFDRVSYSKFIGEKQDPAYVKTLAQLSTIRQTGFIAQEMEKAVIASGYKGFDAVSVPGGENQTYGIAYATLVVPLIKSVQEQQEEITELKKQVEALKKLLNKNTQQ